MKAIMYMDINEEKLNFNIETTIDREKKEKITKLEQLNIGPSQKADIMLVVLGHKLATELYLYKNNDAAEKVKRVLTDIGEIEIRDKKIPFRQKNKVMANIAIAADKKDLDELMGLDPARDHAEYGRLMSYPSTAVDAKVNGDLLDHKDYPDKKGIIFNMRFSREHWQDELRALKEWSLAIKQYSPDTYNMLSGQDRD